MPFNPKPSRRDILKTSAAIGAFGAVSPLVSSRAFAQSNLTVGFLYVGPRDDYGYNQSHAEGAALVKDIPGVTVIEEENVPEDISVQRSMESMINFDGAQLIFPTSFGYFDPHMVAMAEEYPDVQFRHCGGLWQEGVHPMNTGSYFGYIGMGQYLNGIIAGHMSQSKRIGFVAAKPIPQVLLNINSFALGAQSVDPSIQTQVIFTGEWSMAVREAEATNALIDQGADVITMHVDGPKVVVETAAGRGSYVCGYHADQTPLAPDHYLTGAEWNWSSVYVPFVEAMLAGETLPNFTRGGLAEEFVKMSPYGSAVSEEAIANAEAVKAEIVAGGYSVIKGPLYDNSGNLIVPEGTAYEETAIELESMDYLVQGVLGSTS